MCFLGRPFFFFGFASSHLKPHGQSDDERRGLSLSGLNQPFICPILAAPARIWRDPRGRQLVALPANEGYLGRPSTYEPGFRGP